MKTAMLGVWHVHASDYVKYALNMGEVLGAWDPDETKLSAFCEKFGVPAFESLEALLSSDIDAVICTASSDRHCEFLKKAAAAGKDIFTEKVLALTSAECEEIRKAVADAGVRFVISFPQKTTSGPMTVKQIADSGELGKINFLRFRNCHDGSTGRWLPTHFFGKAECGGGAMIDLGAHGMYLTDWFLGVPESAVSTFTVSDDNPLNIDGLEDNAVTVMRFADGCIAVNETGFVSKGSPMRLEVGGTKGFAVFENGKVTKDTGDGAKEVELLPAKPLPIEQFLSGDVDAGFGIEEAIRLTKLMELAYQN